MSFTIVKAETEPSSETVGNRNGRLVELSTRLSYGLWETPHGPFEWDKYFVTHRTSRKYEDFVVIRRPVAPPLDETIARINRAALLGGKAVRKSLVALGTKLEEGAAEDNSVSGGIEGVFEANLELPLTMSDLLWAAELDGPEGGNGLLSLTVLNRYFTVHADNPTMNEHPMLGVVVATKTPGTAGIGPEHMRWEYADALLTPTDAGLPGALGDMSVRAALLELKPGMTSV